MSLTYPAVVQKLFFSSSFSHERQKGSDAQPDWPSPTFRNYPTFGNYIGGLLLAIGVLTGTSLVAAQSPTVNPDKKGVSQMENIAVVMKVKMGDKEGDIEIELNKAKAELSVTNFLGYVDSGFYNGLVFHRVIPNFMIQGGGFDENLKRKPTKAPIHNESNNGLKNDRGTIAMARTNDPHSATSQFYINHADNDSLNFRPPNSQGYAVFGKVTRGMEWVDKIATTPTGAAGPFGQDVPKETVIIVSVKRK